MKKKMTEEEFTDFINVLQAIVDMEKEFVFLIDTTELEEFNKITSGFEILKWMRKNKPKLKKILKGSAVVIKNQFIVDILNWVFERQRPVSPNIICTTKEEAQKFLEKYVPDSARIV